MNSTLKIRWLVLLFVWGTSAWYMAAHLKRGWVPHDEGMLGQSAVRALNGELPNRDFDDYTGGLTFVHALAFHELGISSVSMRTVLFFFFVLWVPAVFYVSSRFGSPYCAAIVTLLAIIWSVPVYPAPMPSWYDLFFATFGTAALLRYVETWSRRWLVGAGICGGFSILAKITGAYFIAAALLFFVFREQVTSNQEPGVLRARASLYRATVVLALALLLGLLFKMIFGILGIRGLIYFVLPTSGLVLLLTVREFVSGAGDSRARFTALMGMCIPFAIGVLLPILAFLFPYVRSHSVPELIHGLIATPQRAIRFAVYPPESPVAMFQIIPFVLPIMAAYECRRAGRTIWGVIAALLCTAVLIFSARSPVIHSFGYRSLATSIPLLVLTGVAILWAAHKQEAPSLVHQQQVMLVICVTALCSLVQFPFAPGYFWYVAPLTVILAAALFSATSRPPRLVLGTLAVFYLFFGVLRISPSFFYRTGRPFGQGAQMERLTLPRAGGLRVESSDARLYEELIPLVQSHAHGKFIYAAPDCPEVYFLSGLDGPTRSHFGFAEDPVGQTERVLVELESFRIHVVAINSEPRFSSTTDEALIRALDQRFPNSKEVGRFEVRWRE